MEVLLEMAERGGADSENGREKKRREGMLGVRSVVMSSWHGPW